MIAKKEQKAWETLVDRAINNKKATPLKEPKEKAVEKEAPKAQEASEVSETQEHEFKDFRCLITSFWCVI